MGFPPSGESTGGREDGMGVHGAPFGATPVMSRQRARDSRLGESGGKDVPLRGEV